MTIEIHSPEVEAIIRRRMSAGGFKSAEDVVIDALTASHAVEGPAPAPRPAGRKSLAQLFADSPFKGLDIDFEREPDYGRDVTL
jgi:hypothetical protein